MMEYLRDKSDDSVVLLYSECQRLLAKILIEQHNLWKQRAKVFWLKDGDSNTKFFHDSARKRRRNNKIVKLRNSEGNWVHEGQELRELMVEYFAYLFKSYPGSMEEVLNYITLKVIADQNVGFLKSY